MSEDYSEVALGLVPPADPKAGSLEYLWKVVTTCETYEIFPSLEVCSTLRTFENDTLFTGFLLLFLALLISAIYYTISLEEIKDLTVIRKKIKKSTDALDNLMEAFWTYKQIKTKMLRIAAARKKANRLKIPRCVLDSYNYEEYKARAEFGDLNSTTKISKPDVYYTHEEDFPIESGSVSLSKIPSETTSLIASEELFWNKRLDNSSTTLEEIPEAYSDVEDTSSEKRKKKLRPPSKEYKSRKAILEQHNLSSNNIRSKKSNGIFSERKKLQEQGKLTKSMGQTKSKNKGSQNLTPRSNQTSTNISRISEEAPKKSGIFKKSKSQPPIEVLNRHKNI